MMTADEIKWDADGAVFQALSHQHRRKILDLLKESPKSTGEICDHLPTLDRCTVMQHIGVLEKAGLLVCRREGRVRINCLDVTPLIRIQKRWLGEFLGTAMVGLSRISEQLDDPS